MIYVLGSFLKKSIFLLSPWCASNAAWTSNQREGSVFDSDHLSPPFNHPHRVVSQHLGSLINTTELLVQQEIPPPACLPPSALLLIFLPSLLLALLPAFLAAGYTSVRALVPGFWRLRMKVRQQNNREKGEQEGREGGRMKNEKSAFRLVGVLWSQRGPQCCQ